MRAFTPVGRHRPAESSDSRYALVLKDWTGPRRGVDAPRGGRWWPWLALVALAVLMAGGCESQTRVPTIAGVIQTIEPDAQGARYVLNTGEVVVDQGRDDQLYPPGAGTPRVGDLLVVGSDGEEVWYVVIAGSSTGQGRCFVFGVNGVDRGDAIDTSIGVRFPKTADFDRGPDTDGNYNEQPHAFCVDDRGEIFAWV